jgi:hypothetical protein
MRYRFTLGLCILCLALAAPVSSTRASDDHDCDEGSCKQCDDGDCDDNGGGDKGFCEELHGAAFGLCNAFCNAQQCHLFPKHSCDVLRENFQRVTGQSTLPCESVGPTFTPTNTPPVGTPTLTRTATRTRTPRRTATATAPGATATATRTLSAATATITVPAGTATATATATLTGSTATQTPPTPAATATQTATPAMAAGFCDELHGAAFGLCNAFCNAQACHLNPQQPSCDELRREFERTTGDSTFPCEEDTCACDCDGDRKVSINDLTRVVLVALGVQVASECAGIGDDGVVTIEELVRGVRNALEGC